MAKKKGATAVADRPAADENEMVPESNPEMETQPESAPNAKHVLEEREPAAGEHERRIKDSRKLLEQDLQPGQKLFEAPDGMVLIAEDSQSHVWYQEGSGGKGCWANPARTGKEI